MCNPACVSRAWWDGIHKALKMPRPPAMRVQVPPPAPPFIRKPARILPATYQLLSGVAGSVPPRYLTVIAQGISSMSDIVTAAMIIIGDEILSGRTKDRNIGHLADILTAIGIDLKE